MRRRFKLATTICLGAEVDEARFQNKRLESLQNQVNAIGSKLVPIATGYVSESVSQSGVMRTSPSGPEAKRFYLPSQGLSLVQNSMA